MITIDLLLLVVYNRRNKILNVYSNEDNLNDMTSIRKRAVKLAQSSSLHGKIYCEFRFYKIQINQRNSDFVFDSEGISELYDRLGSFDLFERELCREYLYEVCRKGKFKLGNITYYKR